MSDVIDYRGYQIKVEHRRSGITAIISSLSSSHGGFEMITDPDPARVQELVADAKLAVDRLLSQRKPDAE